MHENQTNVPWASDGQSSTKLIFKDKKMKPALLRPKILPLFSLSLIAASLLGAKPDNSDTASWTFVSIPDFLNFDIEYPQKGWRTPSGSSWVP